MKRDIIKSWLSHGLTSVSYVAEIAGRVWGCTGQNVGTPCFLAKFPLSFWIPLFIIVYLFYKQVTNQNIPDMFSF